MKVKVGNNFEQEVVTALVALVDVMRGQAFANDSDIGKKLTYQERLCASARMTRLTFGENPLTADLLDRLELPISKKSRDSKRLKPTLVVLDGGKRDSSK